jgi:hypothetical protein
MDAVALIPARLETPGADHLMAVSEAWQRLGSRVEGLVNRVIDEVADAAEGALVPALVGSVQAFLAERRARATHQPAPTDHAPWQSAGKGG